MLTFSEIKDRLVEIILYFVDRASRYKFLLITNLTHFFMYLFISSLIHVSSITVLIIRRSNCINTSSGMISLCKSGGNCSSLLTGIPSSHLHRLIIPDDVLIQFDLLIMSTVMLETCKRDEINKYIKKHIKLVIRKN